MGGITKKKGKNFVPGRKLFAFAGSRGTKFN